MTATRALATGRIVSTIDRHSSQSREELSRSVEYVGISCLHRGQTAFVISSCMSDPYEPALTGREISEQSMRMDKDYLNTPILRTSTGSRKYLLGHSMWGRHFKRSDYNTGHLYYK